MYNCVCTLNFIEMIFNHITLYQRKHGITWYLLFTPTRRIKYVHTEKIRKYLPYMYENLILFSSPLALSNNCLLGLFVGVHTYR